MKALWLRFYHHRLVFWSAIVVAGLIVLFVLANIGTYLFYMGRSYPNTTFNGKIVGSITTGKTDFISRHLSTLPKTTTLSYKDKSTVITVADWGISLDADRTAVAIDQHKFWLPVVNFFIPHSAGLALKVDQTAFDKQLQLLSPTYQQAAIDAQLVLQNNTFVAQADVPGYALADSQTIQKAMVTGLETGKSTIVLPVTIIAAKVKKADIETAYQSLQGQQQTTLTYHYGQKTATITPQDIASWYVLSGSNFTLSNDKLSQAIKQLGVNFGITVQNLPQAVTATQTALTQNSPLNFTLTASPKHITYTYCVMVKDVDPVNLPDLEAQVAKVYTDPRGWSLGGEITFREVSSGCQLKVWLAAPADMTSFSSACDAIWSCTVKPNVIINFDRWRYESDSWVASGGTVDDYKSMVINHETGHWLGFNHSNCSGPGQLAPVMQQQSIDLQGCVFNPWPLPSEQATLRSWLGL